MQALKQANSLMIAALSACTTTIPYFIAPRASAETQERLAYVISAKKEQASRITSGNFSSRWESSQAELNPDKNLSLLDIYLTSKKSLKFDTYRPKRPANIASPCGPSPLSQDEIKALVADAAKRHEVDIGFATAIAWAESNFDSIRNSDAGARGPMQLMPQTALRFGVHDICDPAENVDGGVKYLRVLFDTFQNPLLVAAAYNAGEDRIYEYGGVPPFRETIGYVAKVTNYQLGISIPQPKRKPSPASRPVVADAIDPPKHDADKAETPRKFVGGVMQF